MKKEIHLGPKESGHVTFQIVPKEANDYNVYLNGEQGQFKATAVPGRLRFDLMDYYRDSFGEPGIMDLASWQAISDDYTGQVTPPGFTYPPAEVEYTAAYFEYLDYPVRDALLTHYRDNYGTPGVMDMHSVLNTSEDYAHQVTVTGFDYPTTWQELQAAIDEWLHVPVNITVDELFITTRRWADKPTSDYCAYVTLRNNTSAEVSGLITQYDWQEAVGERKWRSEGFSIPPNDVVHLSWRRAYTFTTNLLAYYRFELEVDGTIVMETPKFYFMPGRQAAGSASCFDSGPGFAVLWYSQSGECEYWEGFYRTPPPIEGDEIHGASIPRHRTSDYKHDLSWPAVFLVVIDPDFIPGNSYWASIVGGPFAREAFATWIQG